MKAYGVSESSYVRRRGPTQGPSQGRPRAAQDGPRGGQSHFGQVQSHQEPPRGQLGANLGQLKANLSPTRGQLGAREAKSDCIFTVFFEGVVKIEFSLPRVAPEAPRDAQEALGAGQERPGAAQDRLKSGQRRLQGLPGCST